MTRKTADTTTESTDDHRGRTEREEPICLRFAGTFGDELEFVEAENEDGEGIGVGEWVEDGEYWILKIGGESDVE